MPTITFLKSEQDKKVEDAEVQVNCIAEDCGTGSSAVNYSEQDLDIPKKEVASALEVLAASGLSALESYNKLRADKKTELERENLSLIQIGTWCHPSKLKATKKDLKKRIRWLEKYIHTL